MENATTSLVQTNPVLDRHVKTATVQLLMALHFHRFFGHPIDGFTPEHNRQRAAVNERTVRAYAKEAGRYAFYAGETLARWTHGYPQAMNVTRIREAMLEGWQDAARILSIDVTSLDVCPGCRKPGHASETDDNGFHPSCRSAS